MSSRFEKIIATAVLAGALALTACSSEDAEILPTYNAGTSFNPAPTSPTGGGPDTTPPGFLSARTIGPGKVELTYSEPMAVGDPVTAAAMFTLKRNFVNFGINWFEDFAPSISSLYPYMPISITSFYSFATAGNVSGSITSVSVSPGDNTKVILSLLPGLPLQEADDDATGKLRLSFTNVAGEVADQAGNAAPNIALPPPNDRGNVNDGSNAPGMIDARTIDANTVELTFSEKVNAVPVAANQFRITENYRFNVSANFFGGASVYWGYSTYRSATSPYFVYNMVPSGLVLTAQQLKIRLTTIKPIGGNADGGSGRLRLYYTPGGSPITDLGAALLQPINPPGQHRGNVIDTIPP